MSKWRPSLLGVSFQSAMLINWPLMRQPLTPPKTANYGEEENKYITNNAWMSCQWNMTSFSIMWAVKLLCNLYHPWNLRHIVKASTNPSPVAFRIAPPFWPNTEGSSVLWNTLKVVWPKAIETNEVNQIMYFMVVQALMVPIQLDIIRWKHKMPGGKRTCISQERHELKDMFSLRVG